MNRTGGVRVLVAGIGNVFLGDDGFGVEVARRLHLLRLPDGVDVQDFGIRGLDLAYALQTPYDAVVFVDTVYRGQAPGTLYLIEPIIAPEGERAMDAHGMDPVRVLALARAMGANPTPTYIVGCEPARVPPADSEDIIAELSPPVFGAVDEAIEMVRELLCRIATEHAECAAPMGAKEG